MTGLDHLEGIEKTKTLAFPHALLRPRAAETGVGSWRPDSAEVDAHVAARARVALDTPDARHVGDIARYTDDGGEGSSGVSIVWSSMGELIERSSELGSDPGSASGPRDITFYKSAGVAAQDVGTAEAVYASALRTGDGTMLEMD